MRLLGACVDQGSNVCDKAWLRGPSGKLLFLAAYSQCSLSSPVLAAWQLRLRHRRAYTRGRGVVVIGYFNRTLLHPRYQIPELHLPCRRV